MAAKLGSPLQALQHSLCSLAIASTHGIVKPLDRKQGSEMVRVISRAKADVCYAVSLYGRVFVGGENNASIATGMALKIFDIKEMVGDVHPTSQVLLDRTIEKLKKVSLRVGELSRSLQRKNLDARTFIQLAEIMDDTARPQSNPDSLLDRISSIHQSDFDVDNPHFIRKTLEAITDAAASLSGYFLAVQKKETQKQDRPPAGATFKEEALALARSAYFRLEELVEAQIYIMEKYGVIKDDPISSYMVDQAEFLRNRLGLYHFEIESLNGDDVSEEIQYIHLLIANSPPKDPGLVKRGDSILRFYEADLSDFIENAFSVATAAIQHYAIVCYPEPNLRSVNGSSS